MLLKLKFKYESECVDCLFIMFFLIIIVIYSLLYFFFLAMKLLKPVLQAHCSCNTIQSGIYFNISDNNTERIFKTL